MAAERARAVLAQQVAARAAHPADLEIQGRHASPNNYKVSAYGTDGNYLTARIRKKAPDILERMKAGEYRSVRAAAIAESLDLLDRAMVGKPGAPIGNHNAAQTKDDNITVCTEHATGGTSATYALRRLRKQRPACP